MGFKNWLKNIFTKEKRSKKSEIDEDDKKFNKKYKKALKLSSAVPINAVSIKEEFPSSIKLSKTLRDLIDLHFLVKKYKIRVDNYNKANSKNKIDVLEGVLALKSLWLEKYDIHKGKNSINSLTKGDLQFVTLKDTFLIWDNLSNREKMRLNEETKEVIKKRILEFNEWWSQSEEYYRKSLLKSSKKLEEVNKKVDDLIIKLESYKK